MSQSKNDPTKRRKSAKRFYDGKQVKPAKLDQSLIGGGTIMIAEDVKTNKILLKNDGSYVLFSESKEEL